MAIIQGNAKKSSVSGFYPKTINGSLRFNDDDTAYLSWTPDSAGDRKTWTLSMWVKRGNLGIEAPLWYGSPSGTYDEVRFETNDTLNIYSYNGSYQWRLATTQVFRDPSAWYHFVVALDTTVPEVKFYVNGEQVTAFSTNTQPSPNYEGGTNNAAGHGIGMRSDGTGNEFDGYMAEVHFLNGIAATPDDFGELKNGVWVAKTYAGDYDSAAQVDSGNLNGFYLNFQDDTEVEAFNTVLYRGNGGTQSITGVGFQPDLVWIKCRSNSYHSMLTDSVRGAGNRLSSSQPAAEAADANAVDSFDSDGFTVDSGSSINANNETFVAWGWKAGGSSNTYNVDGTGYASMAAAGLTDGDVALTGLSVNTTYGFSIVSYTCPATTVKGDTIAHGLGVAPDFMIFKGRNNATGRNWGVYHKDIGNTGGVLLNSTGSTITSDEWWNNTSPTSTEVTLGRFSYVQEDGYNYIAYCWAETAGYSKFDSFAGEGSNNTTISKRIYTTNDGTASGTGGFRPSMIIFKRTDINSVNGWYLYDSTRDTDSVVGHPLFPDQTYTEGGTESVIEFHDDGFTIVRAYQDYCGAGGTYIYAAFADTRDAAFWLDQSGNDNDWQPVNLDHNDTVADSPTNNFPTLNPVASFNGDTLSEGNLQQKTNTYVVGYVPSTIAMPSGQWYAEVTYVTDAGNTNGVAGIAKITSPLYSNDAYYSTEAYVNFSSNGQKYTGGSGTAYGSVWNNDGDVLGIAFDADNGDLYFSVNGEWQDSTDGTFANATPAFSGLSTDTSYYFVSGGYGGGANTTYATTMRWNFGQQPFKYDPPE